VAEGTRTPNTQIHSLVRPTVIPEEDGDFSRVSAPVGAPPTPEQFLPSPVRPGRLDDDLETVVLHWDRLPAAVRAGIVAMVRAAGGPE